MNDINPLTCEEVFRRLDDYLDRELAPETMARVKEHLDTCEVCAREHRFEERMVSELREKLRRIRAPKDLAERVAKNLARLEGENA
jgi:anti-sigma factor (TIGR02949 family)